MEIQKRFGIAVVQRRKELNFSQEKIAIDSGVGRRYMSDIENGHRNISIEVAERIAKCLDLPLWQLFKVADELNND